MGFIISTPQWALMVLLIGSTMINAKNIISIEVEPPNPSNREAKSRSELVTSYDQRQSGKYNIHLSIKDVAFISVDGESLSSDIGDDSDYSYDDYYDYNVDDFTINPISALLGAGPIRPSSKPPVVSAQNTSKPIAPFRPTTQFTTTSQNSTSTSGSLLEVTTTETPVLSVTTRSQKPDSYKPDEIPVEVIMDPVLRRKQLEQHLNHLKRERLSKLQPKEVIIVPAQSGVKRIAAGDAGRLQKGLRKRCVGSPESCLAKKRNRQAGGIHRLWRILSAMQQKED